MQDSADRDHQMDTQYFGWLLFPRCAKVTYCGEMPALALERDNSPKTALCCGSKRHIRGNFPWQ
jgi:hypothetical protein